MHLQMVAYLGGAVNLGWRWPVVFDLSGVRFRRLLTILFARDSQQIIGQGRASVIAGTVLIAGRVTGDLSNLGSPARTVIEHARNGFIWGASMSVSPSRAEPFAANELAIVNGREFRGPLYVIRQGEIAAASIDGVDVDVETSVSIGDYP